MFEYAVEEYHSHQDKNLTGRNLYDFPYIHLYSGNLYYLNIYSFAHFLHKHTYLLLICQLLPLYMLLISLFLQKNTDTQSDKFPVSVKVPLILPLYNGIHQ